jgi:hypothetical protein
VTVVPASNFLAARELSVHAVRVSLSIAAKSDAMKIGIGELIQLLQTTPRLREAIV